mgnify:FL=1
MSESEREILRVVEDDNGFAVVLPGDGEWARSADPEMLESYVALVLAEARTFKFGPAPAVEPFLRVGRRGEPSEAWRWHGVAGHFVLSDRCCFRLHTTVGEYRVSSVGCYHETGSPDVPSPLGGLSSDNMYETMVFRNDSEDNVIDWREIDAEWYATEAEAEAGHLAFCRKYSPEAEGGHHWPARSANELARFRAWLAAEGGDSDLTTKQGENP